jgi:hypothetical protein
MILESKECEAAGDVSLLAPLDRHLLGNAGLVVARRGMEREEVAQAAAAAQDTAYGVRFRQVRKLSPAPSRPAGETARDVPPSTPLQGLPGR